MQYINELENNEDKVRAINCARQEVATYIVEDGSCDPTEYWLLTDGRVVKVANPNAIHYDPLVTDWSDDAIASKSMRHKLMAQLFATYTIGLGMSTWLMKGDTLVERVKLRYADIVDQVVTLRMTVHEGPDVWWGKPKVLESVLHAATHDDNGRCLQEERVHVRVLRPREIGDPEFDHAFIVPPQTILSRLY